MHYTIIITGQFKKDYKKIRNRKALMKEVDEAITKLQQGKELEDRYKVHPLKGNYRDCLECHIKPDWMLIWQVNEDENTLTLIRTGSHSDLF